MKFFIVGLHCSGKQEVLDRVFHYDHRIRISRYGIVSSYSHVLCFIIYNNVLQNL